MGQGKAAKYQGNIVKGQGKAATGQRKAVEGQEKAAETQWKCTQRQGPSPTAGGPESRTCTPAGLRRPAQLDCTARLVQSDCSRNDPLQSTCEAETEDRIGQCVSGSEGLFSLTGQVRPGDRAPHQHLVPKFSQRQRSQKLLSKLPTRRTSTKTT